MIHLFIHIVCYPNLPTVPSDIQLVEMAAGYFGHLDYSTESSFSLGFIRDLAHWARVRTTDGITEKSQVARPATHPVSPMISAMGFLPGVVDDFFSRQVR